MEPAISNTIWRKLLFLNVSGVWPTGSTAPGQSDHDLQEAMQMLSDTLRDFPLPASANFSPLGNDDTKLLHEMSVVNFHFQLLALNLALNQSIPQASPNVPESELHVSRLVHHQCWIDLVTAFFSAWHDTFTASDTIIVHGFPAKRWSDHVEAILALARLMKTWPGEKDGIWEHVDDPNLPKLIGAGMELEKVLYWFYAQSYYNMFGHPPVLPHYCS
ncbi:hypothetical protein PQX77_011555 [Marasmius sp. AFHP31]|nr:hypothetical protein PQX77_011555 [Marasmius sp. AFHP31]